MFRKLFCQKMFPIFAQLVFCHLMKKLRRKSGLMSFRGENARIQEDYGYWHLCIWSPQKIIQKSMYYSPNMKFGMIKACNIFSTPKGIYKIFHSIDLIQFDWK